MPTHLEALYDILRWCHRRIPSPDREALTEVLRIRGLPNLSYATKEPNMSILSSIESWTSQLISYVAALAKNPEIAPFVPLAEKELEDLAEQFAAAHGVDVAAAQKLITDTLAAMTQRVASAQAAGAV
jgi:hypothetical protein